MRKLKQQLIIEQPGIPPVKHPGKNQKKKNNDNRLKLKQNARTIARNTQWPLDYYHKDVKLTIKYYRGKAKYDSANLINGIADALQGPCYDNDSQLVEVHYTELIGRNKKYKRDRYQVTIEPVI